MDMNLHKLWEIVEDMEARCAAIHEVAKSQTRLRPEQELVDPSVLLHRWRSLGVFSWQAGLSEESKVAALSCLLP